AAFAGRGGPSGGLGTDAANRLDKSVGAWSPDHAPTTGRRSRLPAETCGPKPWDGPETVPQRGPSWDANHDLSERHGRTRSTDPELHWASLGALGRQSLSAALSHAAEDAAPLARTNPAGVMVGTAVDAAPRV